MPTSYPIPAGRLLVQPPEDLPRSLVVEFLDKCRHELPRLKAALSCREFADLRRFGHQLKGTGRAYGFPVLTEVAARIEQAAAAEDFAELTQQVDALERYLNQIDVA